MDMVPSFVFLIRKPSNHQHIHHFLNFSFFGLVFDYLQSAIILNDYFDGSFSIPVDDFLPFFSISLLLYWMKVKEIERNKYNLNIAVSGTGDESSSGVACFWWNDPADLFTYLLLEHRIVCEELVGIKARCCWCSFLPFIYRKNCYGWGLFYFLLFLSFFLFGFVSPLCACRVIHPAVVGGMEKPSRGFFLPWLDELPRPLQDGIWHVATSISLLFLAFASSVWSFFFSFKTANRFLHPIFGICGLCKQHPDPSRITLATPPLEHERKISPPQQQQQKNRPNKTPKKCVFFFSC